MMALPVDVAKYLRLQYARLSEKLGYTHVVVWLLTPE